MAALSSAAQAEVAKIGPDLLQSVVELSLPGGTKRYVGLGCPVSSDSLGNFEGKADFGGAEVSHSAEDPAGALVPLQFDVVIEDTEPGHPLDAILYGASSGSVRGSAASVRVVLGRAVPEAEWPPIALGLRIADFTGAGQYKWRFTLRSNDAALEGSRAPIGVINPFDFPLVGNVQLYGVPIPNVLGMWDSRDGTLPGQGPVGALPVYYVNNVAGAYYGLVGVGHMFHIERVFLNGVPLSSAAWQRKTFVMPGFRPTQAWTAGAGRRMSFIQFNSDPGATTTITCDGFGLTRSGIGSLGTPSQVLITNPVEQLRWMLNNVILPTTPWRDGNYLDAGGSGDHALLDTTSWDAAELWASGRAAASPRALRGSFWLGGDFQDGLTLVNDFAASWGFQFIWLIAGKLAIKPRDPSSHNVYHSGASWIRAHEPDDNPIVPERPVQGQESAGELSSETFKLPTQGQARTLLYVGEYSGSRPSQHITSRLGRSRSGTRRQWGAGYARFVRELLNAPRCIAFADAISGFGDGQTGSSNFNGDVFDGMQVRGLDSLAYYATDYDIVFDGIATTYPLLKLGAIAGRPSLVFDGTNDYGRINTGMSNVIPASEYSMAFLLKVTANGGTNADSLAYLNPAVFADLGGFVGLHVQFTGGQNYLQAYHFDGTVKVAKVPISLNQWYVVQMARIGTTVYIATKFAGNSASVVTAGALTGGGADIRIGSNFNATAYFTGEIAALIFQAQGDIAAQGNTAGVFGGGGFALIQQALADLARLPESVWAA